MSERQSVGTYSRELPRPQPRPVPPTPPKPMSIDRLRRQVFTIGIWAHKYHHPVVEDWAGKSVDFLAEQMLEFAAKVARLRADNAAAEAEKASLRAQLEIAQHTEHPHALHPDETNGNGQQFQDDISEDRELQFREDTIVQ